SASSVTLNDSFNLVPLTVTPTVASSDQEITIDGTKAASGIASSPFALSLIDPRTIDIAVERGTHAQHYTLGVTNAPAYAFVNASNQRAGNAQFNGFGYEIALSGDTLAVGASTEPSNAKGINGDESDST